jgi:hypothetical protein
LTNQRITNTMLIGFPKEIGVRERECLINVLKQLHKKHNAKRVTVYLLIDNDGKEIS